MSNTPRIPQVIYRSAEKKTTFAELTTQNEDAGTRSSKQLNALPFAQGVWLRSQSFTAGSARTLQHGLGYNWSGYIVTRCLSPSAIGGGPPLYDTGLFGDSRDAQYITLTPNATFTGDVFIF